MTEIRIDLVPDQISYLIGKISDDVAKLGEDSTPWRIERILDGALLAHEDAPEPRFWTMDLDDRNKADLLRSVVEDDFVYLDDPTGHMVGYLLGNHTGGCTRLTEVLNRGLARWQLEGDGFDWRIHGDLDWPGQPGRDGMLLGASHYGGLLTRLADDALEGLVDEDAGGIVAYVFTERAADILKELNR